MGHSKGSPEREVHSNTGLPKNDGKFSNKRPNPTSTKTRGTTTEPKTSRRKDIIKSRAILNDIDKDKQIHKLLTRLIERKKTTD